MICSSNLFFINNPDPNTDPDPKLRLKPDPDTLRFWKIVVEHGNLSMGV
jgi:hypothetical protein